MNLELPACSHQPGCRKCESKYQLVEITFLVATSPRSVCCPCTTIYWHWTTSLSPAAYRLYLLTCGVSSPVAVAVPAELRIASRRTVLRGPVENLACRCAPLPKSCWSSSAVIQLPKCGPGFGSQLTDGDFRKVNRGTFASRCWTSGDVYLYHWPTLRLRQHGRQI